METEGNLGGVSRRHKKKDRKPSESDPVRVSYMVPDRKTGLQEVEELRQLCPGRTWNFVCPLQNLARFCVNDPTGRG